MNNPVTIPTIQKIAKSKGLEFKYDEVDNSYVALDSKTKDVIMVYAPITVNLITMAQVWREEFNKLKTNVYR